MLKTVSAHLHAQSASLPLCQWVFLCHCTLTRGWNEGSFAVRMDTCPNESTLAGFKVWVRVLNEALVDTPAYSATIFYILASFSNYGMNVIDMDLALFFFFWYNLMYSERNFPWFENYTLCYTAHSVNESKSVFGFSVKSGSYWLIGWDFLRDSLWTFKCSGWS